jgi:hypothetical protein
VKNGTCGPTRRALLAVVALVIAACTSGARFEELQAHLGATAQEMEKVIAETRADLNPESFQQYGRQLHLIAVADLVWLAAHPPDACCAEAHRGYGAWMDRTKAAAEAARLQSEATLVLPHQRPLTAWGAGMAHEPGR